jgi:hypothetical protein
MRKNQTYLLVNLVLMNPFIYTPCSITSEDTCVTTGSRHRIFLRPESAKLRVEWHRSQADIPKEVWESCFPANLEGRWWYAALEQSGLEEQFQFYYAVVLADKPIAIAPCFLMDIPMSVVVPESIAPLFDVLGRCIKEFKCQRTFSVGSPCADEGTVGIAPGFNLADVLPTLDKAIRKKADQLKASMVVWKDFPEASWSSLSKLCQNEEIFDMVSFPGAVVALPADGRIESYYDGLKASRRQKIKKKLRTSHSHVNIEVEIIQRPSDPVRDEIFALFWQTYEKGKTKFERLNPQFFSEIAKAEQSWFILLREKETAQLVAFMLCFKVDGRIINKFIGLDYGRPPEWFLYFRLWDEAVRWCVSQAASELQSGQTGYSAKIELGHELVPLKNFCKHKNPIMHLIYAKLAKSISWATLDKDLELYLRKYPVS